LWQNPDALSNESVTKAMLVEEVARIQDGQKLPRAKALKILFIFLRPGVSA